MANKISTIIDFDTGPSKTKLSDLKQSIANAEGASGKLKAGFKGVKDSVVANAGVLSVAAGGALVAFGIKAVGAFTETAKAALDLSTATGLSTEQASRWIAVGDDYEVSAQALATGLGKVSKTLDDTKWAKYGIATRDASGEARSANDILLDSFDKLSAITNETERARIGQELFGKGYQSLTPILGHTRAEYEKMLGTVEKGQVITDKEAAKAEKMRLAQDNLSDALKDVTLAFGSAVAELAPLIDGVATAIPKVTEFADKVDDLTHGLVGISGPVGLYNKAVETVSNSSDLAHTSFEQLQEAIKNSNLSIGEAAAYTDDWYKANNLLNPTTRETERETRKLTGTMGETITATDDLATSTEAAAKKADAFAKSLQGQLDKLEELYPKEYDAVNAKYAYRDAGAAAMLAIDNLNTTLGDSTSSLEDQKTATDNAKSAILDASEKYATLDGAALGSEGAIRRQIASLKDQAASLAPGSELRKFLDEYIADLEAIPSNVNTNLNLHVSSDATNKNAPGYGVPGTPHASGGVVGAGEAYQIVGEQGPEAVKLPVGSQVIPASQTAAMKWGGADKPTQITNVYVAGSVLSERDLIAVLKRYTRGGGQL